MEFEISLYVYNAFVNSGKNFDYCLDFIISSIDIDNAKENIEIIQVKETNKGSAKVRINEKNVEAIKKIFGSVNGKIIEKLLLIAMFFPVI